MPTKTTFDLLSVRSHKRARACDAQNTPQAAHIDPVILSTYAFGDKKIHNRPWTDRHVKYQMKRGRPERLHKRNASFEAKPHFTSS